MSSTSDLPAWAGLLGILLFGAGTALMLPGYLGYVLMGTGAVCVSYGVIGYGLRR